MTAAIKAELARVAAATDVGFDAGGAAVEAIKRLAGELEAANPTPVTSRADALLKGRWHLLYSSFGLQRDATLARLSFNALPKTPVHVTDLWQEVDPATGLYDNIVDHDEGSAITLGQFKRAGDQRLDVVFTDMLVTGLGATRLPIDNTKIPALHSDVTYLDEDFRLNRGSYGNLYVLQLVTREPATWARNG
jgi:PAP_fibrillin